MIRRRAGALAAAAACWLLRTQPGSAEGLRLSSPAFGHNQAIRKKYTCTRANVSPPLSWSGAPAGTKSFALIADDPDAPVGTWVHWVLYNLPADATGVPQGVPPSERLPSGARQGVNDFGKVGYGGPCPPPGKPHHYYFRVYALNAPTNLEPRASMVDVLRAMRRHVLSVAELMGTDKR